MAPDDMRAALLARAPKFESLRLRLRATRSCQRGIHHNPAIRHACR